MNASSRIAKIRTGLIVAAAALLASLHVEAAPPVKVTAADPSSASQGTLSLDVAVSGSGFDSSAAVSFQVAGTTNPGGVTVKRVNVIGSNKLIATIDVADTAVVSKFDIEVKLSGGRKGKGTSLFAVQAKVGGDSCSAPGLDFPAFAFRRQSWEIAVADASGACIRTVHVITAFPAGSRQEFSYPISGTTNRGRIVWLEGLDVVGVDFTVVGTTLSVEPKRLIISLSPSACGGCAMDLSPNGEYLYVNTSQDMHERIAVNNPADRAVVRTVPDEGAIFQSSVNGDETAIYLAETRSQGSSGVTASELIRVDLATLESRVLRTVSGYQLFWPAADPGSNRIVYTEYVPGSNNCYLLQIADGATGEPYSYGQPRYGRNSTWHGGRVVTNGYGPPNRRSRCLSLDMIVEIDPDTSAQRDLTPGFTPDGA